jgi:hypothetical protein
MTSRRRSPTPKISLLALALVAALAAVLAVPRPIADPDVPAIVTLDPNPVLAESLRVAVAALDSARAAPPARDTIVVRPRPVVRHDTVRVSAPALAGPPAPVTADVTPLPIPAVLEAVAGALTGHLDSATVHALDRRLALYTEVGIMEHAPTLRTGVQFRLSPRTVVLSQVEQRGGVRSVGVFVHREFR